MSQQPHESDSIDLAPVTATPAPVPPTAAMADDEPVVGYDRQCVQCGYNLKGLKRSANCPKCNTPIRTSADLTRLEFAETGWLRTVAYGALLLQVGVIGTMALAAGYLWLPTGSHMFGLLTGGMVLIGAWLLAAREPRIMVKSRWKQVRSYIRPGLSVQVLLAGGAFAAWHYGWENWMALWVTLLLVSVPTMTTLIGFHTFSLARRVPNDTLAANAYNVTWGFLIVALLAAIAGARAVAIQGIPVLAWIAGVLSLALGVWLVLVLTGLTHDLFHSMQASAKRQEKELREIKVTPIGV